MESEAQLKSRMLSMTIQKYEHPLNEKSRTYLRIESLLSKLSNVRPSLILNIIRYCSDLSSICWISSNRSS